MSQDELVDIVEDCAKMFSVSVMYNSERQSSGSLCQYKVSGKEFCYKLGIKKMLETRINVELKNEQFNKL